jgi:hypothetical protein
MKNKRIIDSWSQAEPSAAAAARMLGAILARNQSGNIKIEKREVFTMSKTFAWKRLAPIAACLALAVAAAVVIPRFTAQPIPTAPADTRPTQTQPAEEQIQSVSLPSMLAGQAVKWESASKNEASENETGPEAKWYVTMDSEDGLQMILGGPDTKIVGTLADGRKVTVVTKELRLTENPDQAEVAGDVSYRIVLRSLVPEVSFYAIEVGDTILEFEFTDETGATIAYQCYIEAIE